MKLKSPLHTFPSVRLLCLSLTAAIFGWFVTERASSASKETWSQSLPHESTSSPGSGAATSVEIDKAGDIIVNCPIQANVPSMHTVKYSGHSGVAVWQRRNAGPTNSGAIPTAMTVDLDGNVVATAGVGKLGDSNNLYVVKYSNATGETLWERFLPGSAVTILVDQSNDVIVAGFTPPKPGGSGTDEDFSTIKLNAETGELHWNATYGGPANRRDRIRAGVVDSSNNIVVTGAARANPSDYGIYTVKYSSATGTLLWDKKVDLLIPDEPSAVDTDASGNVFVCGVSGIYPGYLISYAPDDGRTRWELPLPGIVPTSMRVDSRGDVFIAGRRSQSITNDYYVAKRAGTNGSLIWEQTFTSANDSKRSIAAALQLDTTGSAIVTGLYQETNSAPTTYLCTLKYSPDEGLLLWSDLVPTSHSDPQTSLLPVLAVGSFGSIAIAGNEPTNVRTTVYRERLGPCSLTETPDGTSLSFLAPPGKPHAIERATSPEGPYESITTTWANQEGKGSFTDTNRPVGKAFYRTRRE